MTFRGTVRNGRVDLEPGADIPDGTVVDVRPSKPGRKKVSAYRLHELAVDSGEHPKDYAAEIDHYLYGSPKRGKARPSSPSKSRGKTGRTGAKVAKKGNRRR